MAECQTAELSAHHALYLFAFRPLVILFVFVFLYLMTRISDFLPEKLPIKHNKEIMGLPFLFKLYKY